MRAVAVDQLSKSYQDATALKKESFHVDEGELFGVIGPDGAGKTTLFRILTTLLVPDQGEARVAGYDVVKDYRQIRYITGYMPGEFSLYMDLTVAENLEFFATIFNTTIRENYHLIRDIYQQIEPFNHRLARNLSGGMKQKLALSCAMIHKPRILILDEPTTGVDAVSRKEFWEMLIQLKKQGITILVSTPYMDEAGLCDRVALMEQGSIMKIHTPEGILQDFPKKLWAARSGEPYQLLQDLRDVKYLERIYPFGDSIHFTSRRDELDKQKLENFLKGRGHQRLKINPVRPTIEDCFMDLMNQ